MASTALSGSVPPMYEDLATNGDCAGAAHWATGLPSHPASIMVAVR